MKILFVFPSTGRNIYSLNHFKFLKRIPFTFAQLISLTPKEYKITVFDERYDSNFDYKKNFDIVAITILTIYANRGYEIADMYRKRGIPVVIGGYHASALPKEAKKHADTVVIGEAENVWAELLKDFENDKLQKFYKQDKPVDPKIIPQAYRGKIKRYHQTIDVQATRGCPFRCEFCAIQNIEGSIYRKRPIENVIDEIKKIKSKYISFDDPSLTIDVEYTKELFKELRGLKKLFSCHGNINVLCKNEELIKLSKKAGCQAWFIGFESVNQDSLDSVKKKNKVKDYMSGVKIIQKNRIAVKGLFIFGFDSDTHNSFSTTLKYLKKMNLDVAYFSVLTPFPGTPLYSQFDKENRILTKDWSKYNFNNVVFKPKNMTCEELFFNTRKVAKIFFSYKNIFSRTINNKNLNFSRFKTKLMLNLNDRFSIKNEFNF